MSELSDLRLVFVTLIVIGILFVLFVRWIWRCHARVEPDGIFHPFR
jgi:hypothetical protein